MLILKLLMMLFLNILTMTESALIRPNVVYKSVIKGIYDYYWCYSIVMLYSGPDLIDNQETDVIARFSDLQLYFSKYMIPTIISDIKTYSDCIKHFPNSAIKDKTLIVLLNDYYDTRQQFITMLAPLVDMSKSTWLSFFSSETKINSFFKRINVSFNCAFMVSKKNSVNGNGEVITEVYQFDRDTELIHEMFGTWDLENGMQLPTRSLYKRRNNLRGHTLNVVVTHPSALIIIRNKKNEPIRLQGLNGQIFHTLQETMNFTINYQEVDGPGDKLKNGTLIRGYKQLADNSSDIFALAAIEDFRCIEDIDYTTPLYLTELTFFIKQESQTFTWDGYLQPFHNTIYLMIIFLMVFLSLLICFIEFIKNKYDETFNETQDIFKFLDNCFLMYAAFCGQGFQLSPVIPTRVVHTTAHLTAFILLTGYSAILIGTLTLHIYVPPFTTAGGLFRDSSYGVSMENNPLAYAFFESSTSQELKNIFHQRIVKESYLPHQILEGIEFMCNSSKLAFFASTAAVAQISIKNCAFYSLKTIFNAAAAFGLKRNNPFRELMNINILLMRETGVLKKLLQDSKALVVKMEEFDPVILLYVLPLLILLGASAVLGVCFLVLEKLCRIQIEFREKIDPVALNLKIRFSLFKRSKLLKKSRKNKQMILRNSFSLAEY